MLRVIIQGSRQREILPHCAREYSDHDTLLLPFWVPDWTNYLPEREIILEIEIEWKISLLNFHPI
jgi:hypothetical protein